MFDSADGAVLEGGAVGGMVHPGDGVAGEAEDFGSWFEEGGRGCDGDVVGADALADVAADDVVAEVDVGAEVFAAFYC